MALGHRHHAGNRFGNDFQLHRTLHVGHCRARGYDDPLRAKFEPRALSTTFLLNNTNGSRAYYAFPIKQQTMHIQYWKDMLADAGFKESDIPKDWKGYWSFWCDKVQPAYRQKTGQRGFGIGMPMGVDSSDSFYSFLTFMDAYNVKLVSDAGKLLVDDPAVRQGLINALTDYTSVYSKGCSPPSSTSWKDPDNNVAFHNKTTVLTHNATISIAAKWLDDMNNATLNDEQRATAKKNYTQLIRTAGFPLKPDGTKMVYRTAVKTGVVFKDVNMLAGMSVGVFPLKYVTVRTAARSYILDGSLSELEERHGQQFLRVHRNALVARRAVRALEKCGRMAELRSFHERLRSHWGDPDIRREIRWPIHGRIGELRLPPA